MTKRALITGNTGQDGSYLANYLTSEVDLLIGNATNAKRVLSWKPTYTFPALIKGDDGF
jgi:GDP-D-mannose dehydratase